MNNKNKDHKTAYLCVDCTGWLDFNCFNMVLCLNAGFIDVTRPELLGGAGYKNKFIIIVIIKVI